MRVRLNKAGTCFTDPDTGFSIGFGEDEAELPEELSPAIRARIESGFMDLITEVDEPPPSYVCVCGKEFASNKALLLHQRQRGCVKTYGATIGSVDAPSA